MCSLYEWFMAGKGASSSFVRLSGKRKRKKYFSGDFKRLQTNFSLSDSAPNVSFFSPGCLSVSFKSRKRRRSRMRKRLERNNHCFCHPWDSKREGTQNLQHSLSTVPLTSRGCCWRTWRTPAGLLFDSKKRWLQLLLLNQEICVKVMQPEDSQYLVMAASHHHQAYNNLRSSYAGAEAFAQATGQAPPRPGTLGGYPFASMNNSSLHPNSYPHPHATHPYLTSYPTNVTSCPPCPSPPRDGKKHSFISLSKTWIKLHELRDYSFLSSNDS